MNEKEKYCTKRRKTERVSKALIKFHMNANP